eukprot:2011422-Pyramimonas_sp.AAC.1
MGEPASWGRTRTQTAPHHPWGALPRAAGGARTVGPHADPSGTSPSLGGCDRAKPPPRSRAARGLLGPLGALFWGPLVV